MVVTEIYRSNIQIQTSKNKKSNKQKKLHLILVQVFFNKFEKRI